MLRKSIRVSLIISFLIFIVINNSFAGNFIVNGAYPRAESMQAFTAIADDPSAVFYNPGGLTQIKDTQIESGFTWLFPRADYVNSLSGVKITTDARPVGLNTYVSTDALKPVVLAIGLLAPFARLTDYETNPAVYNMRHRSKLVRVDVVSTVAVKITKWLSIGVGFIASHVWTSARLVGLHEVATGYGFSGLGGVLFTLPKGIRLGFTYLGRETASMHGTGRGFGLVGNFDMDFRFPAVWKAGISWEIIHTLILSFNYDRELWSYLDKIVRRYRNPVLNALGITTIDGKDSNTYRIGLLYMVTPKDEIRAGFSHVDIAVSTGFMAPGIPDYKNARVLSVGYSRYFKNKLRFDFGMEHVFSDRTRTRSNPIFPGKYKLRGNIVMAGLSYTF